ncbi:hypothetical protein [Methylohalobius crimeensis]|uniref:hypothetical protein n=1 Tax=Methylohalobius crimeensis TaxID=244365 RepID=UPI0003B6AA8B|nr:hypothetical protein [Methylohalobius crimeensis]
MEKKKPFIDWYLSSLVTLPDQIEFCNRLIKPGDDQKKISEWVRGGAGHGGKRVADFCNYIFEPPENVAPCEESEANLVFLLHCVATFQDLTDWDRTPSEERLIHANDVAAKARELADLLEKSLVPHWPSATDLFDEESAANILRVIPEAMQFLDEHQEMSADLFLSFLSFLRPQKLPPILRRLANYADEKADEPKREPRPNTGRANARCVNLRAFGRHLAGRLKPFYGTVPSAVIAACVNIKYPDINPDTDQAVTAETVRGWLRKR